jgi:hypothetical protein
MKFGCKSKIEMNPDTARKCLITFYNSESDEFDDSTNQAIGFHYIRDGQMNVIALS